MSLKNFNETTQDGSVANDLPGRSNVITSRSDSGEFVSVLTVERPTEFDEGYYVCRTLNNEPKILSDRVYVIPEPGVVS